jgi:DNA invertase Pin-like site-specific DNA recombinase
METTTLTIDDGDTAATVSEHKDGAVIGYARVSTGKQDLALQLDALNQVGSTRVFADTASGSLRTRPELEKCLDYLRAGTHGSHV